VGSLPGGPGFSLCGHESLDFAGYVIGWSLGVSRWRGFFGGMLQYADEAVSCSFFKFYRQVRSVPQLFSVGFPVCV